jgi:hypothetical protein
MIGDALLLGLRNPQSLIASCALSAKQHDEFCFGPSERIHEALRH